MYNLTNSLVRRRVQNYKMIGQSTKGDESLEIERRKIELAEQLLDLQERRIELEEKRIELEGKRIEFEEKRIELELRKIKLLSKSFRRKSSRSARDESDETTTGDAHPLVSSQDSEDEGFDSAPQESEPLPVAAIESKEKSRSGGVPYKAPAQTHRMGRRESSPAGTIEGNMPLENGPRDLMIRNPSLRNFLHMGAALQKDARRSVHAVRSGQGMHMQESESSMDADSVQTVKSSNRRAELPSGPVITPS
jgi:hypothetical protein